MTMPFGLPSVFITAEPAEQVDVYIATGQSRTYGGPNYTGAAIRTTGAYPGEVQKAVLDTGVLSDLVSGYYKGHTTEYPITEALNRLHIFSPTTRLLGQVHAEGGAGISELMPGAPFGIYEEILNTYTAAHAANPTLDFICRAILYFHGEKDRDLTADEYEAQFAAWHTSLQADVRSIGNPGVVDVSAPILGFFDQMSKRFAVASVAGSSLGQLAAHRNNPRMFCVGPTYDLPSADDPADETTFDLHHTNKGSIYLGNRYARAIESVRTTGLWEPVAPKRIAQPTKRKISVTYSVPTPPLRFMTDVIPLRGNYGFLVVDASGIVQMLTAPYIENGVTVILETNRDLVAPVRVKYAQQVVTDGNMFDSDPLISPYDGRALPNPACWSDDPVPLFTPNRGKQITWGEPAVGDGVTVTNPGSRTGTVGTATNLQIQASPSQAGQTLSYSAANLPSGLSISRSSGLISGTPSAAGTYNPTVSASDTTGASGSATFSWTIGGGGGGNTVTVTNPGSRTGTVGTATNLQIQASSSQAGQALSYSAGGLPPGLFISRSSGSISGTPSTAGTYSPTVSVSDTTGASGSTTFSWTIGGGVKPDKVGHYTDSTGNGMEAGLSDTLRVPVMDGSEGGERIGEIIARLKAGNRNGWNIIRGGHNVDLRTGEVQFILDQVAEGVAASRDAVVCGLAMNSQVAHGTTKEAADLRRWGLEVDSGNKAAYGNRFCPLHDLLLTRAEGLSNLTATDRNDIAARLLPARMRASFGNDGHYSDLGKQMAVEELGAFLVNIGWRAA